MPNYIFQPGDEVITIYGERGTITNICTCENCMQRGWPEPTWFNIDTGTSNWITDFDYKTGFKNFYKIGNHRFAEFAKFTVENRLIRYKEQLDELETQLRNIEEEERKNGN